MSIKQSTHAEAITKRDDEHAIVYWRPGCPYCAHLFETLPADEPRVTRVNIWEDPEAAAFVRSLQDGNEVVPTVVIGETVLTAPDGQQVVDALA